MNKEDINDVILFQIDKTSRVSKLYSQRDMDRLNFGITIEQWILLKIIEESKRLSQKELADKSLRDPASITRTIDILEKKGFLKREQSENDRRQYCIILTEEGANFVTDHMEFVREQRRKSTKGFTLEEMELLKSFLLRIQQNFIRDETEQLEKV